MATAYDTANIIIPKSAGYKSGSLYGWNPQTSSLVDFAITRAGATATRVNEAGVREAVAANVPRIDWAEGLSCPSLLVEPQRTNIFPQDLSGAGVVTRTITVANATVYSVSVEGTGSMALSGAGTGTVSEGSPVTFTSSNTSLTLTLTGSLDYCQVEAGAYATSIIFTELVQETRNEDIIEKINISSLLNSLEGSFFVEALLFRLDDSRILLTDANVITNTIRLSFSGGNITVSKNGSINSIFNSAYTINNYVKAALTYNVGGTAVTANGGTVVTASGDASLPVGTLDKIQIGGLFSLRRFYGRIRTVAYFDYTLNSTELVNITT